MSVRVRFTPSATGPLHLGRARTALFNWLLARKRGGQFLVRIEDADPTHTDPASEAAILEDLRWLGLGWDEEVVRQSERGDRYRTAAERLMERGTAYPCFCSSAARERARREQAARGEPARYDGRCRALHRAEGLARRASGEPCAIRFAMPGHAVPVHDIVKGTVEFSGRDLGDFALLREDGIPSANLAAVVDDGAMRVTHVVRGEDQLPNTPRQIVLARALGLPVPAFAHLPLIHGPDGEPLSTRHGAVAVGEYRDAGFLPEAVLNHAALLGWSPPAGQPEVLEPEALLRLFSLDRVARAPAQFDPERLAWFNRQHLRRAAAERLAALLGAVPEPSTLRAFEVLRRGASTLAEVREAAGRLREAPGPTAMEAPGARGALEALRGALPERLDSEAEADAALAESAGRLRAGRRATMQAVRLALTGERQGPPVAALLWALGAEESRRRIDHVLETEGR